MADLPPQLAAYKGRRAEILVELKGAEPLTAKQRAEKLGVSPNATTTPMLEIQNLHASVEGRGGMSSADS